MYIYFFLLKNSQKKSYPVIFKYRVEQEYCISITNVTYVMVCLILCIIRTENLINFHL